ALLMTALTKPDARDYMALPYQEIDWLSVLQGDAGADLRAKKLGLLLDIGSGLAAAPAVRAAVTAAAKAFERAGAVVEPVAPFLSTEVAAGLDGFFQARLLAEFQLLSPERQEKVLPFIASWCRRAETLSAADGARNLSLIMLMREKAVAATEPYDFL